MRTKERPRDRVRPERSYFTKADLEPRRVDGRIDEAPRVDGVVARGTLSGLRSDRTPSVHHGLDRNALAEAVVASERLWRVAEAIVRRMPAHGRGRPRKHGVADCVLYLPLASLFRSRAEAERFLRNPRNWRQLRRVAVAAHPDDPTRRLGPEPPSRYDFHNLRRAHMQAPHMARRLRDITVTLAREQARHTGLFDPSLGKAFEPHPTQMAVSDGTWELALTNATSEPYLNRTTGETVVRRHDPDAYTYHDRSKPVGNMLVFMGAAGSLPGTGVILDANYTAGRHEQDSDVAVRMAKDAKKSLPGLRGLANDKSATGKHREDLMPDEILLINGLPSGKGGGLVSHLLGEHTFRTRSDGDARTEKIPVWAIDGHPCIEVHDGNAMVYLRLERGTHRPRRRRRSGHIALYIDWDVPNDPLAPPRLRGARTCLRHSSTTDELRKSKLVCRHLQVISRYDEKYSTLYNRREYAESINHSFKQSFVNGRARSLGLVNRYLDVLGFIALYNLESLIMWRKHTGDDISRWLGRHDPFG